MCLQNNVLTLLEITICAATASTMSHKEAPLQKWHPIDMRLCEELIWRTSQGYWCCKVETGLMGEGGRPPQWSLSLWLCDCTVLGMWLGGMGWWGGSNQPQSLASGNGTFESQCFISKHKLLDRGIFAQGCIWKKGLLQLEVWKGELKQDNIGHTEIFYPVPCHLTSIEFVINVSQLN